MILFGHVRLLRRVRRSHVLAGTLAVVLPLSGAAPLSAQTDYYNTDAGRPIQIEDAYPVERRAFEIQAAPLRLERSLGGAYHWGLEPELAYGILPRTHIELGVPLTFMDAGLGNRSSGVAGVHLSAFHNLNVETRLPALAVVGGLLFPVGQFGPDETFASVKGIATKTFSWIRFHANAEYTFGDETGAGAAAELSRWMAGVAVDRTFPLRSMLVTGELYAREPLGDGDELEWNTGAGLRYQLSPRWNIDGGIGRRLTGDDQGWYLTFGTAFAVGLPWRP